MNNKTTTQTTTSTQATSQNSTNPIVNGYASSSSSPNFTQSTTSSTVSTQKSNLTVIGIFESKFDAEKAVTALRQQGFSNEEINIISKKQSQDEDTDVVDDDIMDGTLTGATIGGIGGLIVGAGALMIPGIGPILAMGPIAAALSGAMVGGLAGGLIDWGIPSVDSKHYEEEVSNGSILAIIRTDAVKMSSVAQILRQNGAKDVKTHTK